MITPHRMGEPTEKAKDQLSRGEDKKFLCGVAVNVYQNSGKTLFALTGLLPDLCSANSFQAWLRVCGRELRSHNTTCVPAKHENGHDETDWH